MMSKGTMKCPFASPRLRIEAFLLDYIIIAAYIGLLIATSFLLRLGPLRKTFRKLFANPNSSELTSFLLLVLPVILYFALSESSLWQATWGKRKMGIRVTNLHETRLSLPWSLLRSFIQFLPWELAHACLWRIPGWPSAPKTPPPIISAGLVFVWILVAAYLISMFTSKTHQTLYDRLVGAFVVVACDLPS